jgi:aryl-alcohol dehydrogenase-like predicted oxidoreductase
MNTAEGESGFGPQRIGFGCSHITGGFEARSNIRLLRSAYDLGVRHFDTAPLYGHGTSEEVVGETFRRDRHEITIATKVGIPHGTLSYKRQLVRFLASPIRRWTPGISKFATRQIYSTKPATDFSLSSIERSLENSLTKLKTDYVDILLLHEVCIEDFSEELLDKLRSLVSEGKVRRLGMGTTIKSMSEIRSAGYDFEVYQRPWSVVFPDEGLFADRYQIFHGTIASAVGMVSEKLRADPEFRRRLQELSGLEFRSTDDIAKILLLSAVSANPRGLALFSSRVKSRIGPYIKFATESLNPTLGRQLVKVLRSNLNPLP